MREPKRKGGGPWRPLRLEVSGQAEVLRSFAKSELPRAGKGSVFVGAGDSYAAAVAGFYLSKANCLAVDPYALISCPEIAKGRDVFFISVSGKTSSNVEAARKVRRLARLTTAVTADGGSRLAASTERTVKLPMVAVPRSPGFLSFSLSLLAVLRIATGEVSCDFESAFRSAEEDSRNVSFARGTTYFLGNSAAYGVSLYSAAKAYELLGARSHAELLEEFSHLELFSLGRSDSVNIFSSFDPLKMGERLRMALSDRGYVSRLIPPRGSSDAERLFHSVFVAQLAVIRRAEELGIARPNFLSARDRLEISDRMIY
jgi:fructoselysine-6-P-deglycase FrlB-like protein